MKHLLSSTAFLVVNKKLASEIGLNETVLLADLISKEQYFIENNQLNEGYFFNTAKNIQADTSLTPHQQRKAIKKLKSLGIIETQLVGIPAKQHFKIMTNKLLSYFTTSCKETAQQDVKKTQTINKNKEIIINNNISIRDRILENFRAEVFTYDYPKEMLNDFYDYWNEGKKVKRWQKQPTFDISLRLKRWVKNQKKWADNSGIKKPKFWDKGHSKIDSQISEYLKGKELLK
tara:strand:+ start:22 stop:717 length:696 start_codon:yes stop_codon:yes gene_type:complete